MVVASNAPVCLIASVAVLAGTDAFVPRQFLPRTARSSIMAPMPATVEPRATTPTNATGVPTTWECDEDANCVEVPACDEEQCRTSFDVRIHGEWYDLTGTFLPLCQESLLLAP